MAAGARGRTEAAEQYLGATPAFSVDDIGVNPGAIEVIDSVLTGDKIDIERFMAEKINVIVLESSDEADSEIVETWDDAPAPRIHPRAPHCARPC